MGEWIVVGCLVVLLLAGVWGIVQNVKADKALRKLERSRGAFKP